MLKTLAQIEHKIGDRIFHFICEPNSPFNEVKDALFQFSKYIGQIEDTAKAQQAAQDAQKKADEEAKTSVSKIEPIAIGEENVGS